MKSVKYYVLGAVLLLCIVIFLGSFHIVTDKFTVIPKEHFTFSMTFVSIGDIANKTIVEVANSELLSNLATNLINKNQKNIQEQIKETRLQMELFKSALQDYFLDNNAFPTTNQGLNALVKKPTTAPVPSNYYKDGYLKNHTIPKDSWGNDFIYESKGSSFSITSHGSDGVSGGEGQDVKVDSD